MQDKTVDLGKEAWNQSCEQTNGNKDPWKRQMQRRWCTWVKEERERNENKDE